MAIENLQEMTDVDFGTLDQSKHQNMIAYEASSGKFVIRSMDDTLSHNVVLDGDLPDDFVDQIEEEIDVNNMTISSVYGGSF